MTWTEMKLLPLVCFCLLTCSGTTFGDEVTKMGVKEDKDVILPCSLDSTNIQAETFDWKKDDQKEVFMYSAGTHYNNGRGGQDPQFKGRVFHFEDQLQSGNASIVIRNTKVTDSGRYSCIFPHHQPTTRSMIELIVGAAPKPVITHHQTNERVLLQCEVRGASPKPKVVWKDRAGNILPAEEPEVTENEGRYNIILKTTVTKTDNYRCVSTQEEISHEVYTETHVSVYVTKITVKEDEDVILPCSLDSTNIQSDTFDWKKDDQKEVFMYSAGSHYNNGRSGQDPQFKGRVFHFGDQLQSGNASIVIRNTKMTDNGTYTCTFPFPQPGRTRSMIELIVGENTNPAPKPVTTHHPANEGVLLQCEVRSVSPKPEVVWKDRAGNNLTAVESEVTVNKVKYIILKTTVTKTGYYRCVSTQEEIHHEVYTETYVSICGTTPESDDGTTPESDDGSNTGWIVVVVVVVALGLIAGALWKYRARAAICLSRVRSFLCRCFSSEGSQVVTNEYENSEILLSGPAPDPSSDPDEQPPNEQNKYENSEILLSDKPEEKKPGENDIYESDSYEKPNFKQPNVKQSDQRNRDPSSGSASDPNSDPDQQPLNEQSTSV